MSHSGVETLPEMLEDRVIPVVLLVFHKVKATFHKPCLSTKWWCLSHPDPGRLTVMQLWKLHYIVYTTYKHNKIKFIYNEETDEPTST